MNSLSKILIVLLLLNTNNLFSQKNDIRNHFIIKSSLLQEGILQVKNIDTGENIYDASLIDSILIKLTPHRLSIYNSNFEFFEFKLNTNLVSIKSKNNKLKLFISSIFCNKFTIAINNKTGESYRLEGFNGNDLLFLLRDIRKEVFLGKKPRIKKIIKELEYLYSKLNFKCIYKSLKNDIDNNCLQPCSSAKVIISHSHR